jgi:Na+-transporting methylmalonyl-CoA/oxaloacetate decarboxylase gamma subunit
MKYYKLLIETIIIFLNIDFVILFLIILIYINKFKWLIVWLG